MSKSLARQLHEYMTFRASREGAEYRLSVGFFKDAIRKGCVSFFGVIVENGQIRGDQENPEAFTAWVGGVENESKFKYWENMMSGNFYRKGERDSTTKYRVLATRTNLFGPDDCYFDYIKNLPNGTYYVDCE